MRLPKASLVGTLLEEEALDTVVGGRYRLKSFLARGGMGAVFLCDDLRLSGQRWAIKVLLPAYRVESSMLAESFRREAEMLARLRHPSLPAIVDSFVEGERHYLVMEYIAGPTLTRYLEETGPVSQSQALQWGWELAELLNYLHCQNPPVIFRDLKPDNILVSEGQRLKLVDFGLARCFRQGQRRDTQAVGSIGYSPPEQWEDRDQSDGRSDLYGWGGVMHFLLTGKPPSPTYSQQKLAQYRPDLDPRLEYSILKCLEPDPGLRYQMAGELIRQLNKLRSGEPATAAASPGRGPALLFLPALLLALLAWAAWPGAASSSSSGPMQLRDILVRSAPLKAELYAKMKGQPLQHWIEPLQKLTHDFPLDGEAQILLNNARVAEKPALHLPVISSISGSEYEGMQMLTGLALAQREINERGGVRDALHPEQPAHPLVLDFVNCDSRQSLTLEAYQRAASQPQYALAIGPWSSQQLLLISPIVESSGFPTIAPTASDPRTTHLGPNSLTVADTDGGRVRALATYFARQGLKRAAIMSNQESVVGHSAAARFRQEFTALGGSTLADLGYLQDTTEYTALLDQLEGLGADCLFMPDYRAEVVRGVVRQLRARGSQVKVGSLAAVYSGTAVDDGQAMGGLVVSSYYFPQNNAPQVRNFAARYRKFTGAATPSHREVYSYDCLNLIAQAISQAGFERAALRDYLNSLGKTRPPYRGVGGDFSPSRQQETRQVYLLEMREGKLQVLP
jgi:serine/threonine protein kinase